MRQQAVALQLPGWRVAQAVRWCKRALPAALALLVAAIVVQPPYQSAQAVPSKADPALFSLAKAHPSSTFSVIVRETQPGSTAAEDVVRSLGGSVTHELRI